MAAVLDQHRNSQARRFRGRKGDEQCMVTQSFRHIGFAVFLVLANAEHLRGAGFSRHMVGRAP